jgi:RNA polymerase sigma-70 factor (ECF subfamily)
MEYSEQRRNSLAARLRAGDRAAAAELVDIYHQQLYVYFRRLGHSQQVSEDLTQESFMAAWQHIGQLRSGKTLNSWMYQIAGNISKQYWRGHKIDKAVSIEGIDVPDDVEPAFDKTGDSEQLGQLKSAIVELPLKLRQAVVLHYLQHLTIVEAADAAGVRCGTFKSRINRALKRLKRRFISEDGGYYEGRKDRKIAG